jgi:hypothetical protein
MKERIVPMFFFALVSIVCFPAELPDPPVPAMAGS